MHNHRHISLLSAILISINVIMGAGIFVNPQPLTHFLGSWGFLAYPIAAILLIPLIVSLSFLASLHAHAGGLYVYSNHYLSPIAGFIAAWSYFIAKIVSITFLTLTFTKFIQNLLPCIAFLPTRPLSMSIVLALALLNSGGIRIGGKAQLVFISLKLVPLTIILTSACIYMFYGHFTPTECTVDAFLPAIPTALFALTGFEAVCSIGHLIKNPEYNIRRAMLSAFFIVIVIASFFQFFLYFYLGNDLATTSSPLLLYIQRLFPAYPLLGSFLNGCVFTSIIGSAFGMLASNSWNFHTLAKNDFIPYAQFFTKTTATNTPWASLLVSWAFSCVILLISEQQIALQNMAILGMTVSFFLSALAALKASIVEKDKSLWRWIPLSALASCSYIMWLCMKKLLTSGISYSFLLILVTGIAVGLVKKRGWNKQTS